MDKRAGGKRREAKPAEPGGAWIAVMCELLKGALAAVAAAVLTLLAAADTSAHLTGDELLTRLRSLSSAFLVCGDARRLTEDACALLERHRVPLLTWGEQSHPLLRTVDLNAFRAGGGL